MATTKLAKLRVQRANIHQALARLEPQVAAFQAKLTAVEAGIQEIAPELDLPRRWRRRNPVFRYGELTRIALGVLRVAEGPLTIDAIAVRALAAKGITLPERVLRRRTCHDLRAALWRMQQR